MDCVGHARFVVARFFVSSCILVVNCGSLDTFEQSRLQRALPPQADPRRMQSEDLAAARVRFSTKRMRSLLDRFQAVDTSTPPLRNAGDPSVVVRFDYSVNNILHFDLRTRLVRMSGWYRLAWDDDRLRYNGTEEFGEQWIAEGDAVPIAPEAIWRPQVEPSYAVPTDGATTRTNAIIYDETFLARNGYNVLWSRPKLIRMPCDTDLRDFPFDVQSCRLIVGPWDVSYLYRFRTLVEGSGLGKFAGRLDSEEWVVSDALWENRSETYLSGSYEEVHLVLKLQRVYQYHVVNLILPLTLVVLASSLTMWLPISCGERLAFSATLCLTTMATALFTAELRPPSSGDTWLDRFQSFCFLLTFIPVFQSALVVWLQHVYDNAKLAEARGSAPALGHDRRTRSHLIRSLSSDSTSSLFKSSVVIAFLYDLSFCCLGFKARHIRPRQVDVWCRHMHSLIAAVGLALILKSTPSHAAFFSPLVSIRVLTVPMTLCAGFMVASVLLCASLAILRRLISAPVTSANEAGTDGAGTDEAANVPKSALGSSIDSAASMPAVAKCGSVANTVGGVRTGDDPVCAERDAVDPVLSATAPRIESHPRPAAVADLDV